MDFITDYGLFVAKLATVLVFLLALTFGLALIRKRGKAGQEAVSYTHLTLPTTPYV